MNRRGNKIFSELIWNNKLTIAAFKDKYNVQEHSIRLAVKSINDDLEEAGLPTISKNSEGELSIQGKDQIHIKKFEKFIQNYNFYSYTMTKNERHTILALILLNGREYITVDMLKNEIGVSRNTILNDLQELKSWFEDRGMTLKAKPHVGYVIEATETQIRENILKLISGQLGIDFYLDFGLYDLMVVHMKSAVYRVMNGEVLVNPFKDEIINDYPEILQIVHKELENLENFIGKKFREDEVMFLVLYFASVIEKEKIQSNKNKKIPVALVCVTGRGTVQFMLAKLKILEDIIDIVSVSSHHNMNEIEQSGAKMIISTIPLPNSKLPNVAVRSPMLDDQDILTIQQKVFELKEKEQEEIEEQENRVIKQNPQKDIQGAFYNLLSKERIELDYPAKDWEDAIRCAGKILYDTKTVTEQYVEEMVNSVKKHGPYIVVCKGMALPHADCSKGAIEEAASLVRLKTPIEFGSVYNDPVRYVIGMSIKSAESINQAIYDMMKIFGDENNMNKFDSLPDEQAVLDMVNSFQKQKI